jgi:carotenoid cleavage dioxygenase-like enzyme
MGRTKDLLIEDWEREWAKDFVYLLEEQKRAEQEELHGRQPAEIVVVDKRKRKKKNEPEPTYLPF